MKALELRIPPPIVALLTVAAMWGLSLVGPSPISLPIFTRVLLAAIVALASAPFGVLGNVAFHQAKTTPNPMKPQNATSLVTSGIYRFTRNPMYLSLFLLLLAWATFLLSPLSLFGLLGFVLYINQFQIKPEERVLANLFGDAFTAYTSKVRRWL